MFGCSGKLFQLYSLNFITVGDSSAVAYASPVCVVILAHFFLKEKCGLVSIIVALTTCFGVFVITRPPAFTGAASFDTNTLVIKYLFTYFQIDEFQGDTDNDFRLEQHLRHCLCLATRRPTFL